MSIQRATLAEDTKIKTQRLWYFHLPFATATENTQRFELAGEESQRATLGSIQNELIFRLLLKITVSWVHYCDFSHFLGASLMPALTNQKKLYTFYVYLYEN